MLLSGPLAERLGSPLQGTSLGIGGARLWTWLVLPSGEVCEDGLLLSGPERTGTNLLLYMLALFWSFMGVAIAADIFMVGIETITSEEKLVEVTIKGVPQKVT
eukprot:1835541-Prymnesium_polylepis.1